MLARTARISTFKPARLGYFESHKPFFRSTIACKNRTTIYNNNFARFYQTITPYDLSWEMQQNDHFYIIDVRPQPDYEKIHIMGTLNIPLEEIAERQKNLEKDRTVFVHCDKNTHSENIEVTRSMKAADLLREKGFVDVQIIQGSVPELSDAGFCYHQPKPVRSNAWRESLQQEHEQVLKWYASVGIELVATGGEPDFKLVSTGAPITRREAEQTLLEKRPELRDYFVMIEDTSSAPGLVQ